MTTNGAAPAVTVKPQPAPQPPKFQSTPLNQRILATMERRSVAAHPWHDLEIGNFFLLGFDFNNSNLYLHLVVSLFSLSGC